MTDFGISHIWNFYYWTLSKIGGGCHHLSLIYDALMLSSAVYVIKSQVLGLQRAFFKNKIQGSVVPRSIMTNMNYFVYQYGQTLNMPKFNHEKHEICLVPKMPYGGFHLYLSELAFINQFYSIMTRLVRLSLAND